MPQKITTLPNGKKQVINYLTPYPDETLEAMVGRLWEWRDIHPLFVIIDNKQPRVLPPDKVAVKRHEWKT